MISLVWIPFNKLIWTETTVSFGFSGIALIDRETAIESAKCYMQLTEKTKKEKLKPPSLFDAIILATAKTLNAKIITGDEHFKNLKETIWIGET